MFDTELDLTSSNCFWVVFSRNDKMITLSDSLMTLTGLPAETKLSEINQEVIDPDFSLFLEMDLECIPINKPNAFRFLDINGSYHWFSILPISEDSFSKKYVLTDVTYFKLSLEINLPEELYSDHNTYSLSGVLQSVNSKIEKNLNLKGTIFYRDSDQNIIKEGSYLSENELCKNYFLSVVDKGNVPNSSFIVSDNQEYIIRSILINFLPCISIKFLKSMNVHLQKNL